MACIYCKNGNSNSATAAERSWSAKMPSAPNVAQNSAAEQ